MKHSYTLFLYGLVFTLAISLSFAAGKSGDVKTAAKNPVLLSTDDPYRFDGGPSPAPERPVQSNAVLVPIPGGTYTIPSGTYPTLRSAITDLQTNGVAGNVVFELADPAYVDSNFVVGGYVGQATFTVTFKPAAGNFTVITLGGGGTSSLYGILINNGRNLIFDGSNGSPDRSMVIEVDTTSTFAKNTFRIQGGSRNVTLKNMIVLGYRTSVTGGVGASSVIFIDSTGNVTFGGNRDITIEGNHILRAGRGINHRGGQPSGRDLNITVRNNLLGHGPLFPGDFLAALSSGVLIGPYSDNYLIEGNDADGIRNMGSTALAARGDVECVRMQNAARGWIIRNNKWHNMVVHEGPAGFNDGICVGFQSGGNNPQFPDASPAGLENRNVGLVSNNAMYDWHNYGIGEGGHGRICRGVALQTSGPPNAANGRGATITWEYNTWNMNFAAGEGGGAASGLTAFNFDFNFMGSNNTLNAVDSMIIINNIFSSFRGDEIGGEDGVCYLIIGASATPGVRQIVSNHNLFRYPPSGYFGQTPATWPDGGSAFSATLADWQTLSSQDLQSAEGDPKFLSATDYHINTAIGANSPANGIAMVIPDKPTDLDGNPRDPVTPDAGAHEFTPLVGSDDMLAQSTDAPIYNQTFAVGAGFNPKATFKNAGTAPQAPGISTVFEIRDASNAIVYTQSVSTTTLLAANATEQVTYPVGTTTTLPAGTYKTFAYVNLGPDLYRPNDTTKSQFHIQPVIDLSSSDYEEDFDGSLPDALNSPPPFGWIAASATLANDWVLGTPAKTQILGPFSAPRSWVTKLSGNYTDDQESYLQSPILNCGGLAAVGGNLVVEWRQNHVVEDNWDGLALELSVDGGLTWARVDSTLGVGNNRVTAHSFNWANEDSGLSNIDPPYFGNSSTNYAGHAAGWVKMATNVSGLAGLTDVRFRWHFSADASVDSDGVAIDNIRFHRRTGVSLNSGWNAIGNPVATASDSVQQLYPGSLNAYAFRFSGGSGYTQDYTMDNGVGYWEKFTNAEMNEISGAGISPSDSPQWVTPVVAGWNLITGGSKDVDVSTIIQTPGGIITSSWFGYLNGYYTATEVVAGKAFWVKASGPGTLDFGPPAPNRTQKGTREVASRMESARQIQSMNSLTITDATGAAQTLYFGANSEFTGPSMEMPPAPPVGAFDARFVAADGGYMVQGIAGMKSVELPISFQAVQYPVTVSWNMKNDAAYSITDGVGGNAMPSWTLQGTGSATIENPSVNRIVVTNGVSAELPGSYMLSQNYPNPFNPSTTMQYALPLPSKVTVEVYNVLGQLVNTLVNDARPAGVHVVSWNGTASSGSLVGSGVYFVRFAADGGQGNTFTDVRKIMLMK